MDQDLSTLAQVVHALDSLGIPYVLGGSVASSLHGVARPTHDFDFSVALRPEQIPSLVELLGDEFYADGEAIPAGSSVNLIHQERFDKVDLFTRDSPRERLERSRAVTVELGPGLLVRVASPEDIVIRKLDWYRQGGGVSDRQWHDVLGVLKVQGGQFDRDYAVEQAREYGLTELLTQALRDAG